jgi:hypothetical protein
VTTSGFDIHFLLNYKFVKHFPISIILNKYLPIWRLSASFQSENCVLTLNNCANVFDQAVSIPGFPVVISIN